MTIITDPNDNQLIAIRDSSSQAIVGYARLEDLSRDFQANAAELMPVEDSTVALLRFDGTDLIDTPRSGTAETFTPSDTITKALSNKSGVLASNHADTEVFVGDSVGLQSALLGEMTIEAVCRLNTFAGTPYIVWCGGDITDNAAATNGHFGIGAKVTTGLFTYTHEHTTGTDVAVDGLVFPIGEWVHVAATRSSAASPIVKLYMNGNLVTTSGALTAPDGGSTQAVAVAGNAGTANGHVDVTIAAGTALGAHGNAWDLDVVAGSGLSQPLSAAADSATSTITVTLATDSGGDPDDTANTATLVTAALDALTECAAVVDGTGAVAVVASVDDFASGVSPKLYVGGGNNSDTYDWEGDIRDVRISNEAKTDAEIAAASAQALGV